MKDRKYFNAIKDGEIIAIAIIPKDIPIEECLGFITQEIENNPYKFVIEIPDALSECNDILTNLKK